MGNNCVLLFNRICFVLILSDIELPCSHSVSVFSLVTLNVHLFDGMFLLLLVFYSCTYAKDAVSCNFYFIYLLIYLFSSSVTYFTYSTMYVLLFTNFKNTTNEEIESMKILFLS